MAWKELAFPAPNESPEIAFGYDPSQPLEAKPDVSQALNQHP